MSRHDGNRCAGWFFEDHHCDTYTFYKDDQGDLIDKVNDSRDNGYTFFVYPFFTKLNPNLRDPWEK